MPRDNWRFGLKAAILPVFGRCRCPSGRPTAPASPAAAARTLRASPSTRPIRGDFFEMEFRSTIIERMRRRAMRCTEDGPSQPPAFQAVIESRPDFRIPSDRPNVLSLACDKGKALAASKTHLSMAWGFGRDCVHFRGWTSECLVWARFVAPEHSLDSRRRSRLLGRGLLWIGDFHAQFGSSRGPRLAVDAVL